MLVALQRHFALQWRSVTRTLLILTIPNQRKIRQLSSIILSKVDVNMINVFFLFVFCRKALFPHKVVKARDLYGHRGQLTADQRLIAGSTETEFLAFLRFHKGMFKYIKKLDSTVLGRKGRRAICASQVDVVEKYFFKH